MDREEARRLLQALRYGDKKALFDVLRAKHLAHRIVCRHCRESVLPLRKSYDFDQMAFEADCSLCGARNRIPMEEWDRTAPLQWPPAS